MRDIQKRMQFPPLHRLRLGATVCRPCPTGVSPPDDEELKQKYKGKIDAWAKDVDCTICLGPLGLNVDHSEWQPTVGHLPWRQGVGRGL